MDQSADGLKEDLAQFEEEAGSSGQATGDQGKHTGLPAARASAPMPTPLA
jgi:hypothetical protein